jgi:hypothetical protein
LFWLQGYLSYFTEIKDMVKLVSRRLTDDTWGQTFSPSNRSDIKLIWQFFKLIVSFRLHETPAGMRNELSTQIEARLRVVTSPRIMQLIETAREYVESHLIRQHHWLRPGSKKDMVLQIVCKVCTILPNNRIACGDGGSKLRIWNLFSGECDNEIELGKRYSSICSLSNNTIAVACFGEVNIWSIYTCECETTLVLLELDKVGRHDRISFPSALCSLPKNLLAIGVANTTQIWHVISGERVTN